MKLSYSVWTRVPVWLPKPASGTPDAVAIRIGLRFTPCLSISLTWQIRATKDAFRTLVDRTLAYHYSHHMGLITFADEPNTDYEIDDVNYRFADVVEDIQPNGLTALWKALELAKDKLAAYVVKYPNSKQRILVLSDGEDNRSDSWSWRSRNTPSETARRVCETLQVSVLSLGLIFTI